MMKSAVTTVLILASLASAANALQCYTCSSLISSSGCGENDFDPNTASKTTCANNEVCAKAVVGDVVSRACSPIGEGLTDNKCFPVEEASTNICYCSTDLCNSALSKNLGLVLAFIAFMTAKYL
ncbi:lymphocyte antigen 6D-like [Anneissia japonica]|uniref:lymphocyte antigen 6D-like n=1 Tax=Anneissia japonica TaxID=1529436 RepID=UPI0014257475|nr:lymphocyte antigen 6D-like [Anneissia japonica]